MPASVAHLTPREFIRFYGADEFTRHWPTPDFFALPEKRRAFLVQVAKFPGKSIYQIAKDLGMQYRRAHDHAKWLTESGKIKRRETTANNRRKSCLYPAKVPKLQPTNGA